MEKIMKYEAFLCSNKRIRNVDYFLEKRSIIFLEDDSLSE